MNWIDANVLITGATGLIGQHLTRHLHNAGARVVSLVRDTVPVDIPGIQARGDIRDVKLIERLIVEYDIEFIYHLAAQSQVTHANRQPLETLDVNMRGTAAVLQAAKNYPVRRVIVASSDKAYGGGVVPYTEDSPLEGANPYDLSKACSDKIAQMYFGLGVNVAIARCGNVYGEGDTNWNRIIPGTVRSLLRGETPRIRSSGKMIRDYFYVEDCVSAYLALADANGAYNFGSGEPVSVIELVTRIERIMGMLDMSYVIENRAHGEIERQWLDWERARVDLGWSPRYGLDEGLERTIAWYKKYLLAGK